MNTFSLLFLFIGLCIPSSLSLYPLGLARCKDTETEIILTRNYKLAAEEESLNIYRGSTSYEPLLFTISGTTEDLHKSYTYSLCMKQEASYRIEYLDTKGDGWESGSSITLSFEGNTLFEGTHASGFMSFAVFTLPTLSSSSLPEPGEKGPFASFDIKSENVSYEEDSLLTVAIGSTANIEVTCKDYNEDKSCKYISDIEVRCYPTVNNANNDVSPMDCAPYGLDYELVDSNIWSFHNTYFTPDFYRTALFMKITSSVKSEYKDSYLPESKIVKFDFEPAIYNETDVFMTTQNKGLCLYSLDSSETNMHCTMNEEELPEGSIVPMEDDTCEGASFYFTVASPSPFNCTFDNSRYFRVLVNPVPAHSDLPLHMSIPETETHYEERCPIEEAEEAYFAYDPFVMRAEPIKHITACHQGIFNNAQNRPPRGHSYLSVIFELNTKDSSDDYNAAPSTRWFKQELEYALSEVSHVPIKDVYVVDFAFSHSLKSNTLNVIFDTAYEYGRDFMLQFTEQSDLTSDFMKEINDKLDLIYPAYWSVHDLELSSYDIEIYENYCHPQTDAVVEFSFIDRSGKSDSREIHDAVFESTILWYYSYVPVAESEDYQFTGAITRYCKPKYYEAVFDDYTDNTQAQVINVPWEDVHFILLMEKQNPRGANIEVRYSVARSIARAILNEEVAGVHTIETYDVNVYMVEGDTLGSPEAVEGDDAYKLYQNTKFYVEVRVRDRTQRDHLLDHLRTHAIVDSATGEVHGNIESSFFDVMRSNLGESFRTEEKSIKILNVM